MSPNVFAIALNHQSQMDHWHDAFLEPPYKELPKKAVWFIKPRNTHNVNNGEIVLDPAEQYYSGGTFAIVIGKKASRIKAEDACEYIEGFALANEISLAEESFYRPAIKAKCQDNSCPVGSVAKVCVASIDIETWINGEKVDCYNTRGFIRNAGQILEALTDFATLEVGDMVLMGTPQKRVAIKSGDKVEIKAQGFETLVTFAK